MINERSWIMKVSICNRFWVIASSMAIMFSFTGCSASEPIGAQGEAIATMDGVKERLEQRSQRIGRGISGFIDTTGTIRFVRLEGGFYVIDGDDGEIYDPMNLPARFRKDGYRVRIKGIIADDAASFHMYGTIIRIKEIEPIGSGTGGQRGHSPPHTLIPNRD